MVLRKEVYREKASSCSNFWSKQMLRILFNSVFKAVNPFKVFRIPSWIPTYSAAPSTPFDLTPPSFKQITKVVRKMKASGSPCPLDQISIICFKRCPYLRSFITEAIAKVWVKGCIPNEWKIAVTILIHKKGESEDPANFRPITLERVTLKIFTACLRDKIFEFLKENNYIEHNLQKGFIPKAVWYIWAHCANGSHDW